MPETLLEAGMVLLGCVLLYAEIRLERYRTEQREARVNVEERAIERGNLTGGSVGGRTPALGAGSAGSAPARRTSEERR